MKRAGFVAAAALAVGLLVFLGNGGPAFAGTVPWSAPAAGSVVSASTTGTSDPTGTVEPTGTVDPTSTVEPTGAPTPTSTVEPAFPSWMKRFWGRRVHRIITKRRVVALTFDDGPNFRTKQAIRILKRYGAKGTFFATGYQSKKKGMAAMNRLVLSEGMELANHTMDHERLNHSYGLSVREITSLEKLLIKQTGHGTRWVRAMGGAVNSTGLRATRATKHLYAQWSVSIQDSVRRYTPPGTLYHNVVDHVRPGAIVLMHVTHLETLKALPRIVAELKRRGYKMVTLSEMAPMGRPYP